MLIFRSDRRPYLRMHVNILLCIYIHTVVGVRLLPCLACLVPRGIFDSRFPLADLSFDLRYVCKARARVAAKDLKKGLHESESTDRGRYGGGGALG